MIVEELPRTQLGQRWRGVLLLLTGDDMGGDGSSAKGLRGLLGRGRTRIHGIVCDHPAEAVRSALEALLGIYRDAARQGAGVVIAIG